MTTVTTLRLPEGAIPAPDGLCHLCGNTPGEPYSVHGKRGPAECAHWRHAHPEDPAILADGAVLGVLIRQLELGGDVRMNAATGARMAALLADTIRIFTDHRDGAR